MATQIVDEVLPRQRDDMVPGEGTKYFGEGHVERLHGLFDSDAHGKRHGVTRSTHFVEPLAE